MERGGPVLNMREFRQALIRLKQKTPQLTLHLNVRSDAAFARAPAVIKQIEAAGFDIPPID